MVDKPLTMEQAGGFVVHPVSDLPEEMRERIKRRKFEPNPDRTKSDYDEMEW